MKNNSLKHNNVSQLIHGRYVVYIGPHAPVFRPIQHARYDFTATYHISIHVSNMANDQHKSHKSNHNSDQQSINKRLLSLSMHTNIALTAQRVC